MAGEARDVEPTGPEGLGASRGAVAQVGALTGSSGADPLTIDVIGQQWLWRFEYPGGAPGNRVFSYGELVVPVDTTVILRITSTDVMHRWFIPALGGQVEAVPGKTSETWFRADRGRLPRAPTFFAGSAYATMRAWVRVVSPAAYERYVRQKREELAAAQGTCSGGSRRARQAGSRP